MALVETHFTVEDVVHATGLKPASVRAYLSKKLVGKWVTTSPRSSLYRASGIRDVSAEEFEAVMTQNSLTTFRRFEHWKEHFSKLVRLGVLRDFPVEQALDQCAATLRERPR